MSSCHGEGVWPPLPTGAWPLYWAGSASLASYEGVRTEVANNNLLELMKQYSEVRCAENKRGKGERMVGSIE